MGGGRKFRKERGIQSITNYDHSKSGGINERNERHGAAAIAHLWGGSAQTTGA